MKHYVPVSVIIPTYNRAEAIKRTLDTIEKESSVFPEEIIVVDQSQDTITREEIRKCCEGFQGVRVKYVFLETPSSTKARNIGIENATNDVLVFMDDDVDVNRESLHNIYDIMNRSNVAMLGAIDETLPTSNGLFGCLFAMKSFKNRNIGHVTKSLLGRYPQKVIGLVDTMWAMGFCFSVKKNNLTDWNLSFDEQLTGYAYAEDLDLTYRYYKCARRNKLKCVLSDMVKVKHLETKECRIPNKRNIMKYVINRKYLAFKYNEPWTTHVCMKWANVGLMVSRVMNHEPYRDICEANRRCNQLVELLKQGIIKEEFFNEDFDLNMYQR